MLLLTTAKQHLQRRTKEPVISINKHGNDRRSVAKYKHHQAHTCQRGTNSQHDRIPTCVKNGLSRFYLNLKGT
ncbi:MAG: hypothetical protein ACOCYO_07830 [Bacteroidota bacterium]